jgi:hypothetical protein
MDRYVVLAHLAAAERHIAEGQARLERQEQTQELHLQDRDRILDELGR